MSKKTTIQIVTELSADVAAEMNIEIWHVTFEKEGSSWFLRYFIDKPDGVNINDCENFSHKMDAVLDEADPITQSYYLEVSSPGVERELSQPHHFSRYLGSKIHIRTIRPINNVRDFIGSLLAFENSIISISVAGETISIPKNDTAFVRLSVFDE